MDKKIESLYKILKKAILECNSTSISLSGGLDSSIIGYFLQPKKINAISIFAQEFLGTDLTYSQMVAKKFGFSQIIKIVKIEDILTAIDKTIKILGVFNDIEIRNSVVMYLSLEAAKNEGYSSLITGDGADELFAGYNFFLKMNEKLLKKNLERIWKIMHFPTQKIGKSLGIKIESPFLNETVIDFAKSLPVHYNIKNEGNKRYGKWILRKTFEKKIPNSIVWRKKSAMQDGAGTSGLQNMFNNIIPDKSFTEQIKNIKENDNVIINSKESLHYYLSYRKYYQAPLDLHSSDYKCPYCKYKIIKDSKFCSMCGRFPI